MDLLTTDYDSLQKFQMRQMLVYLKNKIFMCAVGSHPADHVLTGELD